MKMAEGNPGAITVCLKMMREGRAIDPDSFAGGFTGVLAMDTYGIYGSRIWMLYKDVCGENLEATLAVLRACQLGLLRESVMHHAIDNYGEGVDVPSLLAEVKGQLGLFGVKEAQG
jgi:hypothetical protein